MSPSGVYESKDRYNLSNLFLKKRKKRTKVNGNFKILGLSSCSVQKKVLKVGNQKSEKTAIKIIVMALFLGKIIKGDRQAASRCLFVVL